MKPTRSTLRLSVFISTSLRVSGNYVPISRRTYSIRAPLVLSTLYGEAVCSAGWDESHPNRQTRQPPTQSEKYQCRIDTVCSPADGHIVARNM